MYKFYLFLIGLLFLILLSCQSYKESFEPTIHLIPLPVHLEIRKGYFEINKASQIQIIGEDQQALSVANYFKDIFQQASGISLKSTAVDSNLQKSNVIVFEISNAIESEEEYHLFINEEGILLQARDAIGLFYGVQTLRQLLPVAIDATTVQKNTKWRLPSVDITDKPRFAWRGMHLDVSRHFFPKEFIKKYLDHLARYKFNKFHWHLTDGPGWRIEIEKYPKLITTGSWRVDKRQNSWNWSLTEIGKPTDGRPAYGGYYSKDDIREIIQYASDRFIEVIPEIEMPGHSHAALMAYPELACENNNVQIDGVNGKDVFCVAKEETYTFLEGVIDEVIELFPSKFFHLGGDEVGKQAWIDCGRCQRLIKREGLKDEKELQSYFIEKVAKYIERKGKEVIGWDEIMEGGLALNSKVMSWRGMEGGIRAANMGHDVIMAPNSYTYFDLYQGNPELEPEAYSRLLLSKVYQFDPIPTEIEQTKRHHILGGHGCLWTEYIQTPEHVEYMLFPRILALSEKLWSPKEELSWSSFLDRMEFNQKRLEFAKINYSKSAYQANINVLVDTLTNQLQVRLKNELDRHDIRYTLDGSAPDEQSTLYKTPVILKYKSHIKAATFRAGKRYSQISSMEFNVNKATGKKVTYENQYHAQYPAGGDGGLVNGLLGTIDIHDGQWQGFQADDADVLIDLGELHNISKVQTHFNHNPSSWVYLPNSVVFEVSIDGKHFERVATFDSQKRDKTGIELYKKQFTPQQVRYIRIVGENIAHRPGRPKEKAWVFIDEIIVE